MDKATKIADEIWNIEGKDGWEGVYRCQDAIENLGSYNTDAQELAYIWGKNIRKTCEKFKQKQLSDPIAYLVLLHSVSEFLEKNDAKQF